MSDDNVRKLPTGEVDFDLDSAEKDPSDVRPIFAATVKGRRIEMTSPDDVDWQDLLFMENPVELLQFVISREDLKFIREQSIEGWRLGKLMDAYSLHYGLDERMRKAQREQRLTQISPGR